MLISTFQGDHKDFKRPSALKAIKYHVHWPVGRDDTWIETSGELHTNYISKYRLYKAPFSDFDCILGIYSVRNGVKYTFYDESGDSYLVTVYRIGEHYIQLNSETIVSVEVEVEA
jgi:hypothetical protein